MFYRLKYKAKTIKHLEKIIGQSLHNLRVGKDFLEKIQKAQTTEEEFD